MQIDVAVAGATGAVGEAVLEYLAERRFPVGRVFALAQADSRGERVAYGERRLVVEPIEQFELERSRIVFCCPGTDRVMAEKARRAGALVIDSAGLYWTDPAVPLVACGVNAEAIDAMEWPGAVTLPYPPATQLAQALAPLRAEVGLERVDVLTCRSVSARGQRGVEELAHQTAQLLNARPVKPGVFPRQIAFNLLGQEGSQGPDGMTDGERDLVAQVGRLLDDRLEVCATTVIAPVFHGDAQAVHVRTREPIGAERARALWQGGPGIRLMDDPAEAACPSPVTDAARDDALVIGRVRSTCGATPGLQFWSVVDGIRRGQALHSVQIAEILVKAYL
jgi:aspartate-semialdehyde dehydrogenase